MVRPSFREVLTRVGLAPEKNEAVCAIVARHHSPPPSPSLDFLILYESDWLVNIDDFPEIKSDPARLQSFIDKNFHSPAGLRRARQILLGDDASSRAFQEENPLFKRMGAFYKLLVDEEKRRAKEAPYLLELAQRAIPEDLRAQSPVLDLACGTGFHSRILASGGFRVLAIDSSAAVLAEAAGLTAQAPPANPIDYRAADLFDPLPADKPIRLALLLGNTLSLFPPADASRLIAHITEAIAPGGIFLLQILNFQRLRRVGGSTVTRHGMVNGREALFTKALAPTDEGNFLLTMTASQPASDKPEGDWESLLPKHPNDRPAAGPNTRMGRCRQSAAHGRVWRFLQGKHFPQTNHTIGSPNFKRSNSHRFKLSGCWLKPSKEEFLKPRPGPPDYLVSSAESAI